MSDVLAPIWHNYYSWQVHSTHKTVLAYERSRVQAVYQAQIHLTPVQTQLAYQQPMLHRGMSHYWPVGSAWNQTVVFQDPAKHELSVMSHLMSFIINISQSPYAQKGHRMTLDTRVISDAGTGVSLILQKSLGVMGHSVTIYMCSFSILVTWQSYLFTTWLYNKSSWRSG